MRRDIGAHQIEVDGDLVIARSCGRWTLQETEQMIAIWNELLEKYGRLFEVGDFSDGIELDAAVRRLLIDWSKTHQFTALAIVVKSLPVRAIATLVVRGAQLVNPGAPSPLFCSTFEEGYAFVEQARKQRS
ncbi:MAG TPA: hypothetical protein PKO07_01000 [Pseudomonadota bacterium]|jgi:hypothetical protein|nr:hypothetical protein [Pseudomonadota bacterium]HNI59229.1 hypothetical protein [Pseudomonadota bacterium]HNN49569.1 hypothetical protein [Pseudomonadota bacterium]